MLDHWQAASSWRPPARGDLDLWRIDLQMRADDLDLLSDDERRRAERLVVDAKRTQLTASRAALRRILARYVDTPPQSLVFEYGDQGKPSLREHPSLSFNLSHSHDRALVGITRDTRIGVDVELLDGDRPLDGMAGRFFAPGEFKAWLSLSPAKRIEGFYCTWTRKEAYLKAWGTGLTFPSRLCTTGTDREGAPCLESTEMPEDDASRWRLADVVEIPGYLGAICWEDRPRTVRYWREGGESESL